MIDPELADRLDRILRRFLELKKSLLEQRAEINTLASLICAIPPLQAQFNPLLKTERGKLAGQVSEIDLELAELRLGALRQPERPPN